MCPKKICRNVRNDGGKHWDPKCFFYLKRNQRKRYRQEITQGLGCH